MAELLYLINEEEEHKKCKWLARFFVNDEPCYILVDCSTAHKQYDFVEVLFAGKYYEYLLYSEPPKSEN